MKEEKPNTFAEMEKSASSEEKPQTQGPVKASGEIDTSDFSDTPVGDKVKYERPDLNGKEDVVNKFQVFIPDTTEEPKDSKMKTSKYWSVSMTLTYNSQNADGVNNREFISGAICFQQKDGSASDVSFWYEGCKHQSGMIWKKVAEALGKDPKDLSPRQFIAFLNNKPKVKIQGKEYENYGAPKGSPPTVTENMPQTFIVAEQVTNAVRGLKQ